MQDKNQLCSDLEFYTYFMNTLKKEKDIDNRKKLEHTFITKTGFNTFIVTVYDSNLKDTKYISEFTDQTISFNDDPDIALVFDYKTAKSITQKLKDFGLYASYIFVDRPINKTIETTTMTLSKHKSFTFDGHEYKKDAETPFYVRDDGKIYIKYNNEYLIESNIVYTHVRKTKHKYPYVYAQIDGKQKHYIATQIIGRTFVPNDAPGVKNIILNTNEDGSLNPKNMKWVTLSQQLSIHAQLNRKLCTQCHTNMTNSVSGICTECHRKNRNNEKSQQRKKEKLASLISEFKNVDRDVLTTKQTAILDMRLSGKTYEEIGDTLNISRQRVQQILSKIKKTVK